MFLPTGRAAPVVQPPRLHVVGRPAPVARSAARHGWIALTARVLAATVGNYALVSLLTALFARIWPVAPAQASMAATLLGLAVFPILAMTSFAMRSPWRLWASMLAAGVVAGAGLWLSLAAGGRL